MAVTHFVGSRVRAEVTTGSRTHPWLYARILSGLAILRESEQPRD